APAEGPQLLVDEEALVTVRPAQDERRVTEAVEGVEALGRRCGTRGARGAGRDTGGAAGITWAVGTEVAVRKNALVPISPSDTECVATHLLQRLHRRRCGSLLRVIAHASSGSSPFLDTSPGETRGCGMRRRRTLLVLAIMLACWGVVGLPSPGRTETV